MTWLIGKLIGATFPGAGLLLSLARGIGAVTDWTFKNVTHLLIVALTMAVAFGTWERGRAEHWHAKAKTAASDRDAVWRPIVGRWQSTDAINRHSLNVVTLALVNQNVLVRRLGDEGAANMARSHAALLAASQRAQANQALLARMRSALASGGAVAGSAGQCRTDPSQIAAAKGGVW